MHVCMHVCVCRYVGKIKKVKGNWGRKEGTELGGLLSTSPAAVPGAQANLTYMHQHSHTPVPQLLPCGVYLYT